MGLETPHNTQGERDTHSTTNADEALEWKKYEDVRVALTRFRLRKKLGEISIGSFVISCSLLRSLPVWVTGTAIRVVCVHHQGLS